MYRCTQSVQSADDYNLPLMIITYPSPPILHTSPLHLVPPHSLRMFQTGSLLHGSVRWWHSWTSTRELQCTASSSPWLQTTLKPSATPSKLVAATSSLILLQKEEQTKKPWKSESTVHLCTHPQRMEVLRSKNTLVVYFHYYSIDLGLD